MKIKTILKLWVVVLLLPCFLKSCDLMKKIKSIYSLADLKQSIKDQSTFVIFYKPNCPSCQKIAPLVDKIYDDYKDDKRIIFIKINFNDTKTNEVEFMQEYQIETVPTIILQNKYNKIQYRFDAKNEEMRTYNIIKKSIEDTINNPLNLKSEDSNEEEKLA